MKKLTLFLAALACAASAIAQDYGKFGVYYEQRATLFDVLPIEQTDIIMLGNSLTNICEWSELLGMPNVKNRGISGDIVTGVSARLAPIAKGKPAKIFLMIGVNDISHNLTADSIVNDYTVLIDSIRTMMPDTKLYVQSCLPFNITFGKYLKLKDKDDVARQINAKLQPMAEEKGFTWINLYPAFANEDGYLKPELTNDGLHLLAPGYLLWRDCLLPYINE